MRSIVFLLVLSVTVSGCLTPRGNGTAETPVPDVTPDATADGTTTTDDTADNGTDGPDNDTSPSPTPTRGPESHTVTIGDALLCTEAPYRPADIAIVVGDSVVWDNDDDCTHTASGKGGAFETGNIAAGKASAAIVFDTAGAFDYICSLHPQMAGTVTVSESEA